MQGLFKLFSFAIVVVSIGANSLISHIESYMVEKFTNWLDKHNIVAKDNHHLLHMFENWLTNDKYIEETNLKNLSYTVGHNAYSGMNSEEFSKFMRFEDNREVFGSKLRYLRGYFPTTRECDLSNVSSLASSVDWRTKGVVSSVRNQGNCGSCWSFSGTSTVESAVAIKTGHLYDLSEQQSVSCAGLKYGNLGCGGGMYNGLWNWDKNNNGICSEADYPYTSGTNGDTGSCIKSCSPLAETKISSYVAVTPNSDYALMEALNVGPVSIAIEADTRSFQLYSGGVYSDYEGCNSNFKTKGANSQPNIDHAVVLVGYGSDDGQDYYILRNSWGTSWGDVKGGNPGYMLIARGSAYGSFGMCGVLYDPMYPVV